MIFKFFFGILKKTSVGVIKNMVSNCLGDQFWEKMLTGNSWIFFSGHWAKTFRPDSNRFLPRKWNTYSTDAEGHFWGTHFHKKCSLHFLRVSAENCQTPGESYPAELTKLHFTLPEEQCGFCAFSDEIISSWFCLGFEWITLQFHQTIFSRFVKTAFFRVQRNIFDEKSFFIEFIKLDSCSGYELTFSAFKQKSFGGVVKTAFYRSGGKTWGRIFFWKFIVL